MKKKSTTQRPKKEKKIVEYKDSDRISGENGSPQFRNSGDTLLDIYFKILRDSPTEMQYDYFKHYFAQLQKDGTDLLKGIEDYCTLLFIKRDCRGGKGERVIFYNMWIVLSQYHVDLAVALLDHVSEYGYWLDLFKLLIVCKKREDCNANFDLFKKKVVNIVKGQLKRDVASCWETIQLEEHFSKLMPEVKDAMQKWVNENLEVFNAKKKNVSLMGKWLPRERKHIDGELKIVEDICLEIFGADVKKDWFKMYRQVVTCLNKVLNTPEILMCSHRWSLIDYTRIPSRCLNMTRKAHLNLKIGETLETKDFETGNRYPGDEDRVKARSNLIDTLINKKIHGAQMFPHELVKQVFNNKPRPSLVNSIHILKFYDTEELLIHKQFEDIIFRTKESMEALSQKNPEHRGFDLGKLLPLSDVSGSMAGDPMHASIALGLIVSELKPDNSPFKNLVMTFHDNPALVSTADCFDYVGKIHKIKNMSWGGSTNFEKAMDIILNTSVQNNLPFEQVPDLIVFSDMQFNQASQDKSTNTMFEVITNKFRAKGYPRAPHIVFWNLRGDTSGVPVKNDTQGVTMLSGFSPSQLKHLLSGEPLDKEVIDEVTKQVVKVALTPMETFQLALKDERYNRIKDVVKEFFIKK